MTIHTYADAVEFFSKARDKTKGRPLKASGWRMFKDGDEFVFNYGPTQIARVLPDNTIRFTHANDWFPQGAGITINTVIPFAVLRRGKGHYRVHTLGRGELSTGQRLYDGLTYDLNTLQPVGYKEPTLVTDPAARRLWLAMVKRLKTHLKTVVKLGGLTARVEALKSSGISRWHVYYIRRDDLPAILAALDGDTEAFVQRLAEHIYRTYYSLPDTGAQCEIIDNIITGQSLDLRKALGVVTQE